MSATETQGTVIKRGDGGSPEVFTNIGQVVSIGGPDGEAAEIDTTHLASTAMEYLMGLRDEGNISLGINFDGVDAQQAGLRTDRDNRTNRNFRLVLSDSTQLDFAAYVKSFPLDIQPNAKVDLSVTLRITGAITWS